MIEGVHLATLAVAGGTGPISGGNEELVFRCLSQWETRSRSPN